MQPNVLVTINALDKTKEVFRSLSVNLDRVSDDVQIVSSKIEALEPAFKKMAAVGTAAFVAIGGLSLKAIGAATDLGESINAVNVVFGDGADDILKFGQNAAKSVGLSTAAFNQMATITGALLKDTGLGMADVAGLTNNLALRAADMASVFNTDVNDAMSAINQAIRGETEAIRRYAGDVTDATLETYLLSQGVNKSVTELTEQEKRLYRVQLIMAQTAVTQGDFANTADSLANRQRVASAEMQNLAATIGTALQPVLISLIDAVKPVVDRVSEWIKQNPDLTRNIILATGAIAGLVAIIGMLGLAFVAFNPIAAMIVGALVMVGIGVNALATTVKNYFNLWQWVWEGIKDVTATVVDYVLDKLDLVIDKVQDALDALASLPGVKTAISITKSAFKGVSELFGRAVGGPVMGSTPYIVGEQGPELFVPTQSGSIMNAGALGRMQPAGVAPIYITISNNSFMGERDMAEKVGDMIIRKLKNNSRL